MTLAKPKTSSLNTAFTPLTLSSAKPSWHMMWHGLKVEVLSLKHRPDHRYLDMRQECRTSGDNKPVFLVMSPKIVDVLLDINNLEKEM